MRARCADCGCTDEDGVSGVARNGKPSRLLCVPCLWIEVLRLDAANASLRKALTYYATSYNDMGDNGHLARAALKKEPI